MKPLSFGEVAFQAGRVMIIGSGASLIGVDLSSFSVPGVFVIAVNDAIRKVPGAHAFFTCDPGERNRSLLADQRPEIIYYAAVPGDYGRLLAENPAHRAPAEPNVTYLHRVSGKNRTGHTPGLSEDPEKIHSGNSAYGALGVAYLMRAKKVALFGVDGVGGYAWDGRNMPRDLTHLPSIFETTLPQLQERGMRVVNGSPESTIRCFPRMTVEKALDWIR